MAGSAALTLLHRQTQLPVTGQMWSQPVRGVGIYYSFPHIPRRPLRETNNNNNKRPHREQANPKACPVLPASLGQTSKRWELTFFPFFIHVIRGLGSPVAWHTKEATPPDSPIWSSGTLTKTGLPGRDRDTKSSGTITSGMANSTGSRSWGRGGKKDLEKTIIILNFYTVLSKCRALFKERNPCNSLKPRRWVL